MAQLKDLIVAGSSRFLGKLFLEDTVTLNDSLILTKNADVEVKLDNKPALIIGDPVGEHLEFDDNEIMAKKTGTTSSTLFINYGEGGGLVKIGPGGLKVEGTTTLSGAATAASTITTTYGQASNSSTTGDIRVGGGIYAAKTSFFDTTLYTGTTSFYILGDSTSKLKNLELTGTLKVTGATTLSSTLGVTGATTLKSTLGVTGATTLSSTLTTNGATTLKSTLTVESGTTLKSTLGVAGIATFSNGEAGSNGKGAVRITGGLSTTKPSWIGGGLLTIKSSNDVSSSAITLWRGTNASWKIENASGTLHFNCNYTTSAQSTYTSLFSIAYNTGVIQTKGTINLSNGTTYYINGSGSSKLTNLSLAGTLGVTGATTLTGAATLKSTLGVSGVATFANTVKITQGSAASSTSTGALQITGGLSASANSYFGADVTVVKNLTAKTLTISDTSGIAHLIFSRGSYNYIHAKTAGGVIAFVVNGQTVGSATSEMVIQDGIINPGTTNVTDLGSTSLRWKGIYANTANFGGNLTVSGTATITKSVTINDGTASTSKTTGALKVSGGIGATGQVNAQSFRIDNAVKFVYNSTDKCVDVIFE